MKLNRLSKRLIAKAGVISAMDELRPVWYAVEGLPDGQDANLHRTEHGWIIKRNVGGKEYKSRLTYASSDNALVALETQVVMELVHTT